MPKDVIAYMRGRAARCRWLAQSLNLPDSKLLLKLAEEIDADIRRMELDQRLTRGR